MEHIWELNGKEKTGVTSSQAYEYLQTLPEKKSRASVINFLNDMVEEGILEYKEESGKGGYHRIYYPKMDRDQFVKYVTRAITDKLHEVFP
jgi:predicted transcriptional regulator